MHPASMFLLNEYVATGTQLKLERPGKAACITACDTIEGPIIKTKDGSVVHIRSLKQAKQVVSEAGEILFLGDILISYGDFFNRAHKLVPPGYCEEWWFAELQEKEKDKKRIVEKTGINQERIDSLFQFPISFVPSAQEAILFSQNCNIPLHPYFTYHWKSVFGEKKIALLSLLEKSNIMNEEGILQKIILPYEEEGKRALEIAGVPHTFVNSNYIVFDKEVANILFIIFDLAKKEQLTKLKNGKENSIFEILEKIAPYKIKYKSGLFIGARMGRPEKAKMRKLTGSPQVLFPVGEEGGRFRCFQSSLEAGKITAEFPTYFCKECAIESIYPFCEECDKKTTKYYFCNPCKKLLEKEECNQHGPARSYRTRELDVGKYFSRSFIKLNMQVYPDLIKGVKGTSNKEHIPEHMVKGILRAKHDIYVNKDGTTRYDMTQLPLTHFKQKEI